MTFRIERSSKAREDLLAIWLGIAIHDPDAADRQLRRIEQAIRGLADFPRIGPIRDDLGPGIRAVLRVPHLIFYTVEDADEAIRIIRVIDARRDLEAVFQL